MSDEKRKPGRPKKSEGYQPKLKPKSTRGGPGRGQGRKKGSFNKSKQEIIDAAKAGGEMPLEYMLRVMRDPNVPSERRDDMAKAAAPYVHARLSVTKVQSSGGIIIKLDHDDEQL